MGKFHERENRSDWYWKKFKLCEEIMKIVSKNFVYLWELIEFWKNYGKISKRNTKFDRKFGKILSTFHWRILCEYETILETKDKWEKFWVCTRVYFLEIRKIFTKISCSFDVLMDFRKALKKLVKPWEFFYDNSIDIFEKFLKFYEIFEKFFKYWEEYRRKLWRNVK